MITKPSRIVIKTQLRLGFVIIYLNQSSERNMIDIPGCSERTNFKLRSLLQISYCGLSKTLFQDIKLMRFRAHVLHSLLEGFVQR